jgi:cytochrome c biogenesis protein CcmG/thiol:disulfide interchange protein DsbE
MDAVVAARPTRRRRPHTALIAAGVVGCMLLAFVIVLATRTSAVDKQSASPLLGKLAPEIAATTLDGKSVRLSDLHGKYVLVNFFASWCVPCAQEHPELLKWSSRHAPNSDAVILGVIFSDSVTSAHGFIQRLGGDWPIIDDPQTKIALDWGVRGPPESFVVGRNGEVLAKYVGRVSADGLDNLLARARVAGI